MSENAVRPEISHQVVLESLVESSRTRGHADYIADARCGVGRARLAMDDGAGAIAPLERALGIFERGEIAPMPSEF